MMRYSLVSLLFLILSTSCSPAALRPLSGCELCAGDQTCLDDECFDDAELCGGVLCAPDDDCVEDRCVDPDRPVVFATFNLYDLENTNAADNLARYIDEYEIDVITFQEIQPGDAQDIDFALAARGISMFRAFSSRGGYGGDTGDDYLAVFSRHPISGAETILGGTYVDPVSGEAFSYTYMRPVLKLHVTVHDHDLTVYNLHLKAHVPFPDCENCLDLRRTQAHALENYILGHDAPETDLILIAGDANTAIAGDFEPGNTLDRLTLRSDNPAQTANDFTPVNHLHLHETTHTSFDSELDHLILSPALMHAYVPDSVQVIAPAGRPSDHKSVLLRLKF